MCFSQCSSPAWTLASAVAASGQRRGTKPRASAATCESGLASSTRYKMAKALEGFIKWLEASLGIGFVAAMSSAQTAALALRAYGLHLYSTGHPRYLLVYALTAVQNAHPEFRMQLASAWQIDKKWQAHEPGECRPVISQPILQAAVSIGLLWGWYDWVAVTIIGFLCMLHPAEMGPLTRQDLVLPEDAMSSDQVAYVHIRSPKTQRFARRQHGRLDDAVSRHFLTRLYLHLPLEARLFQGSLPRPEGSHPWCPTQQ